MTNLYTSDLTEDALALQFAERYQGKIVYDYSEETWYEYYSGIWKPDRTGRTMDRARKLIREVSEDIRDSGEIRRLQRIQVAENVIRAAKTDQRLAILASDWNTDPSLLGVPSGVINLQTGAFFQSRPTDYISQQANVRPDASHPCPIWEGFINEVTGGDPVYASYLQRLCGYCLTGETKEQKFFFLYGEGGNGKSVFLQVLQNCMGSYARSAAMETFLTTKLDRHPTELAMLSKARLVTAVETDRGRTWNESRVKELTGGDQVSARFMRQDFFTYQPQFKIVITGNHKPQIEVVTDAMRRRIVVLQFLYKPAYPDQNLPEKLKLEYPGILAWMVNGASDWYASGLPQSEVIIQATHKYLEDQDFFAGWLDECCEVNRDHCNLWTSSSDLWESWRSYASSNCYPIGTRQDFTAHLRRHGATPHPTKSVRGYMGIRLRHPKQLAAE